MEKTQTKMNSIRLLGSRLSLLKNANSLRCTSVEAKNFSSLLSFSSISNNGLVRLILKPFFKTNLNLTPSCSELVPRCGIKVYGKPKPRCKFCYYAGIEGVVYVFCTKYPRHKQRALMPSKRRYNWILTHACQSKYRPY